jgi:hypothetical protein
MHETIPTSKPRPASRRWLWLTAAGGLLAICLFGTCGLAALAMQPGWRLVRGRWVLDELHEHVVDMALRQAFDPIMTGEREITFHALGGLTDYDRPIGRTTHGTWRTVGSSGNVLTLEIVWDHGATTLWDVTFHDSRTIEILDASKQRREVYRWSRNP